MFCFWGFIHQKESEGLAWSICTGTVWQKYSAKCSWDDILLWKSQCTCSQEALVKVKPNQRWNNSLCPGWTAAAGFMTASQKQPNEETETNGLCVRVNIWTKTGALQLVGSWHGRVVKETAISTCGAWLRGNNRIMGRKTRTHPDYHASVLKKTSTMPLSGNGKWRKGRNHSR